MSILKHLQSIELHADAIIWIASEESPQDDHQCDYGYAGNYVKSIGAEESGGSNFEDDENAEQHGDALQWTTSQNPRRTRGHVSELFVRREPRHGLWCSWSVWRVPF